MEWTPQTVVAHHAVYSCITRIAQDIGKLRPKLVEKDDNDIWTETTSPAFSPVLTRPNRFQNHIQFKEWWITSKLFSGNAYALKERDDANRVRAIYILDPTRVTVMVSPDGEVFYQLRADNLAGLETDQVAVPASEIVHDRMNCLFHPLVGTSPIFACGTAANMGLSIQNNSSTFFENGSNPNGILASPLPIDPKKAAEYKTQWDAMFGPGGPGGVAVLGNGMKFERMSMSAADSQLIEQLQWTAETVCGTFHVPPFKVGIGQQPTYQNAEILNQIYYSDCLQSLIEQYEACMDEMFGFESTTNGKTLGIELDLDGLLRMDTASQVETLTSGISGSLFSINEARKKMDLKPMNGGESILSQQQYYDIKALAERDKNDPFAKAPSPPAVDAVPAQKALPASTDNTAGRMARLAAVLEINASQLRIAA